MAHYYGANLLSGLIQPSTHIVFVFEHRVECLHCFFGLMFRLVMSGPVSLSLSIFSALILGSVCSIWAKFSNGDNYRGRLGERRRWVLPVYRVSCMLLQASQLHLPVFPLLPSFQSLCVITGLVIIVVLLPKIALFFPHPALKTQNKT